MSPTPAAQARPTGWSLEIVRGRDVGTRLDVRGAEVVLGNGLDGAAGLDLKEQEAGSPRRMAPRQAVLECRGPELNIRDLDSPGGTFVNRRRLLNGQSLRLAPGDEIQLGGVLLRVGGANGPAPAPVALKPPPAVPPIPRPPGAAASTRLAEPYSINGVVVCRTWDDFLVAAAQRWGELRAELTAGRLEEFLRRIRRTDLLPAASSGEPDDETLDRWLGRLPVSQSSAPELDVLPDRLEVRGVGGTTRHSLRITNVGYRLLRSVARVEPADTRWLRILTPFDGRAFTTIEETELPIEVAIPDDGRGELFAEVVIESNGGTRRIPVRCGPPTRSAAWPDAPAAHVGPMSSERLGALTRWISAIRTPTRIAGGIVLAVLFRLLVLASGLIPIAAPGATAAEPGLPALAILFAAVAAVFGVLGNRRQPEGGLALAPAAGVAAGLAGVMLAAVAHALVRTIESPLGVGSSSIAILGVLWATLGAALAGLSCWLLPSNRSSGGVCA